MPHVATENKVSYRLTFFRQLLAHASLHSVEFLLTFGLVMLGGELAISFQYSLFVVLVAFIIGVIAILYFVSSELESLERIRWLATKDKLNWTEFLWVDGKRYGKVTLLASEQAKLATLTSFTYVYSAYFAYIKQALIIIFQMLGIGMIVFYVLTVHSFVSYTASTHQALSLWLLKDYANAIMIRISHQQDIAVIFMILFGVYKALVYSNSSADTVLEKCIKTKLLARHQSKIKSLLYSENLKIKLDYDPDSLRLYEFEGLSEKERSDLELKHHGATDRLLHTYSKEHSDLSKLCHHDIVL